MDSELMMAPEGERKETLKPVTGTVATCSYIDRYSKSLNIILS